MQALKKEVELMGQMTRCTDAFLGTHTRLVVIVDGLDSCEQEKLLQVNCQITIVCLPAQLMILIINVLVTQEEYLLKFIF